MHTKGSSRRCGRRFRARSGRCQAHFKRNVIKRNVMDQTPASYKDRMDQVLDQILRASSQQEAQDRFDDFREELAEEASSALEVLEDGLYEATRRRGPAWQVPQATPHDEA